MHDAESGIVLGLPNFSACNNEKLEIGSENETRSVYRWRMPCQIIVLIGVRTLVTIHVCSCSRSSNNYT